MSTSTLMADPAAARRASHTPSENAVTSVASQIDSDQPAARAWRGVPGQLPGRVPRHGPRQLLREIRELGYQGSPSLLVRYINQGRAEGAGRTCHPAAPARILLTRPDRLTAGQHETLAGLTAACR